MRNLKSENKNEILTQAIPSLYQGETKIAGYSAKYLLAGNVKENSSFTVGFILELRRFLRKFNLPWKLAITWLCKICSISPPDIPNEGAVCNQWTKLYVKRANIVDTEKIINFENQPYHVPKTLQLSDNIEGNIEKPHDPETTINLLLEKIAILSVQHNQCITQRNCARRAVASKRRQLDDMQRKLRCQIKKEEILKNKFSKFTPRNSNKREKRKEAKICKQQQELLNSEIELKNLKDQLINEQFNKTKLTEKVNNSQKTTVNAQKRASRWKNAWKKLKLANSSANTNYQMILNLRMRISELELENTELEHKLETLTDNSVLQTYEKKYSDDVRETYWELLASGVSIDKCEKVVRTVVEKLCPKKIGRLPKKTCTSLLQTEALIVSQGQVAAAMLDSSNNNTLHTDGTKRRFREYAGYQISTSDGNSFSMGLQELTTGDAESFLAGTLTTLTELAEAVGSTEVETSHVYAQLLKSIKNTMTDRHVVNKQFKAQLQEVRETILPKIVNEWDGLTDGEKNNITEIHGLYCGLHVLINMASSAKSVIGFCHDLIYQCCKALTESGCAKSGCGEFKAYLEAENKKCHLITFIVNCFNVLFINGAAVYYHWHDISSFFHDGYCGQTNKLLQAISNGMEISDHKAMCRALGIIEKIITGPLWRLLEERKHIFEMNSDWELLYNSVLTLSKDATDLLHGEPIFTNVSITKDCVWVDLFTTQDTEFQSKTKECLQKVLCSFIPLLLRQLHDQLPGGKYHQPSQKVIEETAGVPRHNKISEANFGDLDRLVKRAPQKATSSQAGVMLYVRNKTGKYLMSLSSSKRRKYLDIARKHAKQRQQTEYQRWKEIIKKRQQVQAERKRKKDVREQKLRESAQQIAQKVHSAGLWCSDKQVDQQVQLCRASKSDNASKLAVKEQIKYHVHVRKVILIQKSPAKFQKNQQPLSLIQLAENLKTIIKLHPLPNTSKLKCHSVISSQHLPKKRKNIQSAPQNKKKQKNYPEIQRNHQFAQNQVLAVAYDTDWFVGEVLSVKNNLASVKFLQNISTRKGIRVVKWPTTHDIKDVDAKFVLSSGFDIAPNDSSGRTFSIPESVKISKLYEEYESLHFH